jgi:hypothetical protein
MKSSFIRAQPPTVYDIQFNMMAIITEFFIKEEYNDFHTLFWIPDFLSNPYRERYFTGSSISSTK